MFVAAMKNNVCDMFLAIEKILFISFAWAGPEWFMKLAMSRHAKNKIKINGPDLTVHEQLNKLRNYQRTCTNVEFPNGFLSLEGKTNSFSDFLCR